MKSLLTFLYLICQLSIVFGQQTEKLITEIDSIYLAGNVKEAFDFSHGLVKEGNKEPLILHRLGMIYLDFQIDQPKEGLSYLEQARELTSNDSLRIALHLDIAQAKYSLMQYEEALEELEILYNKEQYRGYALTIAMNIYTDTQNFNKALVIAREVISTNPDFMPTIVNVGYLFLDMDMPDSAITYFERASQLNPNDPIIINNMGNAYYKKGDLTTAIKLINQSIELLPNNSYAFRNRAYVLFALERTEQACADIEKAIELDYLLMYGNDILELKKSNCQ